MLISAVEQSESAIHIHYLLFVTHTHKVFIVFSSCPQGVFQGSGVNFRWQLHGRQDSVLFMRCSAHGYLIIPVGDDKQT